MKKGVILLFAVLFISIMPFILADEESQVDDAYICLNEKINSTGCMNLSFEEQVFSLLAVQKCRNEVANSNLTQIQTNSTLQCWPSQSCSLKSTSQALLGLNAVNYNTLPGESWLLSRKTNPTGIDWFLEIESSKAVSCDISYSFPNYNSYSVNIGEDKKISSGAGPCLSLAGGNYDSYFLKVSPSCYDMDFDISCSESFITTLLFKKQDSSTSPLNVLEAVHGASPGGLTTEKVVSWCFSNPSGQCDYEGSLWATQALYYLNSANSSYLNNELSPFLPYLITFSEDNKKFIPESFLYYLTGSFRADLLLRQTGSQYWLGEPSGDRYYDTALALLPFQEEEPFEKTNSKNWLLKYQEESGCWDNNNLRNTAFILYSIWPRYSNLIPEDDCDANNPCPSGYNCVNGNCLVPSNGTDTECDSDFDCSTGEECVSGLCAETSLACEAEGYFCMSPINCEGNLLPSYTCSGISKCCDAEISYGTCSSQGGDICSADEDCQGGLTASADDLYSGETCCISGGECVESETPGENSCLSTGGSCRISCLDSESESQFYDCEFSGDVCCFSGGESTANRWIIWALIALIFVVVLAIVFRDKIKMFFMRLKSRKKDNKTPSRPVYGGLRPLSHSVHPTNVPRRILPSKPIYTGLKKTPATPSKKPFKYRKELDEVLGKLKEIGKDK
jgi:hypothetical protein